MDERQAKVVARALGGETWQSGGDMWMVLFRRSDGKVVGLTGEVVCLYADEELLQTGKPEESILLT